MLRKEGCKELCILGVGGAGLNVLDYMNRHRSYLPRKFDFWGIDADRRAVERVKDFETVLIGKSVAMGMGCGKNLDCGYRAARENDKQIIDIVRRYKRICIICGLAGGTGAGASLAIMEIAKQNKVEVTVFAFKPFMFEQKNENALKVLEAFREKADKIKVYDNDEALTNTDPNVSTIEESFAIIYDRVESDLTRSI